MGTVVQPDGQQRVSWATVFPINMPLCKATWEELVLQVCSQAFFFLDKCVKLQLLPRDHVSPCLSTTLGCEYNIAVSPQALGKVTLGEHMWM